MDNNKIAWKTVKKNKCIVVENKVYDVSEFKHHHPGGSQVLEDWMGKDCTEIFNNVMHSQHARDMMKDYYVGELDTESAKEKDKIDYTIVMLGAGIFAVVAVFVYYKMCKS